MESKEEQDLAVDIDQELNEVPSVYYENYLKWSDHPNMTFTWYQSMFSIPLQDLISVLIIQYYISYYSSLRNVSIKWGAAIQVKILRNFDDILFHFISYSSPPYLTSHLLCAMIVSLFRSINWEYLCYDRGTFCRNQDMNNVHWLQSNPFFSESFDGLNRMSLSFTSLPSLFTAKTAHNNDYNNGTPKVVEYRITQTQFHCFCFCTDSGTGGHQQEGLIKRYHEIHFDYSTEFKNTSVRKIKLKYCYSKNLFAVDLIPH